MSFPKNSFPKRGPRVMHGLSKLLEQARSLPSCERERVMDTTTSAEDKAAMDALGELLRRLARAENTVARIRLMVEALQEQCNAQPEDHIARVVCEMVLQGIRDTLAAEDNNAALPKVDGDAADACC